MNARQRMMYRGICEMLPWYRRIGPTIRLWLDSWNYVPCHKEMLGYNCKHHVYKDGTKECGGQSWGN